MEDTIFRAYDVRGTVPDQLNTQVAYAVAKAYFEITPGSNFIIGYDMRESSLPFARAFAKAAQDMGRSLVSLGRTTTDMLYFGLGSKNFDGGIMITASHNPKHWNGIKLMGKGVVPIDMNQLRARYQENDLQVQEVDTEFSGEIQAVNYDKDFTDFILSLVDPTTFPALKVIVDAGNGMGGLHARKVFQLLPMIEVIEMYFEPNANFPHHQANPVVPSNTKELSQKVISENADLGIAFDGDGDRCVFVDENGNYVSPHIILAIFARYFLQRSPGAKIAYEYRNIYALDSVLKEYQGVGLPSKAGHSFFKELMHREGAIFGGESSAHYYFQDTFNADSGILPFLLIFQILGSEKKKLSELVNEFKYKFYSSGELNFILQSNKTVEEVYQALTDSFHPKSTTMPDGLVIEFDNWRLNARPSNTEPMVRINIEALSENQLEESITKVHEVMGDFAIYLGDSSYSTQEDLHSPLKDRYLKLLQNLWYTWNPHYILPIIDLYGDGWRKNSPPGEFASQYGKKRLDSILTDKAWEIEQNLRLFDMYMDKTIPTHYKALLSEERYSFLKVLEQKPIAYFSLEYGLVDWLQIYSGGLGVLAGDYIKQASDMGLPLVALGIFYHQGYFHQDFNEHGEQVETYIAQNPEEYPLELLKDESGNPVYAEIEIVDHIVYVRAWKLKVGRVDLYLLDTNFEANERYEDKMISAHLYGGDQDTRIRQEILLGIGGPRVLKLLGIEPSLYHMNEGHSGFLVVELARRYIEEGGLTFEQAVKKIDDELVFTNHTLKQAGNDIFSYELIEKYFVTYLDNLKTDLPKLYDLGKDDLYAEGNFSMTILGLRNAKISNAVSKIHGQAAAKLWPDYNLVPVTNGVHMPTWVSPEIHQLLDAYVGENWHIPGSAVDFEKIQIIPDSELWQAHFRRKEKLINSLNNELGLDLKTDALTVAWSRRLTAYKRPDMIVSDLERLKRLVGNEDRPLQILISGKAHPKDTNGKEILARMNRSLSASEFSNKVVLLPGYNWQLARRIVSGADVWLNTPYRFEEASGTSGMKAAANGVLQLTTRDGWTDEVDWFKKGWVIDEQHPVDSLHDTLEYKLIPLFFELNASSYNTEWVSMMKNSMQSVLYEYSTERMIMEYLSNIYGPILKAKDDGES